MDKNFYEEYYFLERNHWWFKVRGQIISDLLVKNLYNKKDLKILNVGIATGKTTELLNQFGLVSSVEYDKDCCEFVQAKLGIDVINGSILDLPFKDKEFDLVCAFDVIEHVEDDHKAVQELYRVCKDNSIVFITVPAFMSLWSHHDEVNHHYRRYIMPQILNLFKNFSGQSLSKSYFNSLLFLPVLGFRLISKVLPQRLIREGSGSDFTVLKADSIVNKLLYFIFNLERQTIKYIKYPIGVSIFYMFKKSS